MKTECQTGSCPPIIEQDERVVKLSEGAGGKQMHDLIQEIRSRLTLKSTWNHTGNDAASRELGPNKHMLFTSDSYVVTPLFFPGGNIGTLAFSGTVNDLVVMGANPLGLSLNLILEEGFSKSKLFRIIDSINQLSSSTNIPIVTGDTKVMERGAIDGMVITTSGVGCADSILDTPLTPGDKIICSGSIGEHGAALLAKRFELQTTLVTDSKPLVKELLAVREKIKQAKDITRGGVAAVLNELASNDKVDISINEVDVPQKREVQALTQMLGIDLFSLACEGRFICVSSIKNAQHVVKILKEFHPDASIIGEVIKGEGVTLHTKFGPRRLPNPSGNIVPRIC